MLGGPQYVFYPYLSWGKKPLENGPLEDLPLDYIASK